jgi:hypothetical protein
MPAGGHAGDHADRSFRHVKDLGEEHAERAVGGARIGHRADTGRRDRLTVGKHLHPVDAVAGGARRQPHLEHDAVGRGAIGAQSSSLR